MSEANTQQPTKKGKGKIRRNDFLLFLFILILAAGWMIFSRFQSTPGPVSYTHLPFTAFSTSSSSV